MHELWPQSKNSKACCFFLKALHITCYHKRAAANLFYLFPKWKSISQDLKYSTNCGHNHILLIWGSLCVCSSNQWRTCYYYRSVWQSHRNFLNLFCLKMVFILLVSTFPFLRHRMWVLAAGDFQTQSCNTLKGQKGKSKIHSTILSLYILPSNK